MIDKAADQDEMVDLIHKYVYTDRPRDKAAPSILNGTMRINTGAAMNIASLQDQLSWFQSEDLVDADITLDQAVDQ
jgi:NitT/TauT family transport system substrate-binding protein